MKKAWSFRKNQEAVSPVIATILLVAITVVLASTLYVMVSGLLPGLLPGSGSGASIVFDSSAGNKNWTLGIHAASPGLQLSGTTATVVDWQGNVVLPPSPMKSLNRVPLSSLTAGNWNSYYMVYHNTRGDGVLGVGDTIDIGRFADYTPYGYMSGSRLEVVSGGTLLAMADIR